MENIEGKIIDRDSFITLLINNKMSLEEANILVDSIYNIIYINTDDIKSKKNKESSTESPEIHERNKKDRDKTFAEFYYLTKNIYDIEQLKNLTHEARNEIVKKIMAICKDVIDIEDGYNSWDYTKSNDFIKLLFEKYNDTNSDRIIECIENYVTCEKKDLIDRIINKLVIETEKPCNIEQITDILGNYFLILDEFSNNEKKEKGNNKKINLEKSIELAELCIEKELPNIEIVNLFKNISLIIIGDPKLYYDIIETNYEQAKKGKIEIEDAVEIIEDMTREMVDRKNKEGVSTITKVNRLMNRVKNFTNKKNSNTESNNNILNKTKKEFFQASLIHLIGIGIISAGVGALGGFLISNKSNDKGEEEQQYEELMEAISDDIENTGYVDNLPISIQCDVIEDLGPYGPEAGSSVIARVSKNGEMKSIIWQDTDGSYKTITNNLENYMKCLSVVEGIRETKIISNCKGEDEEYKKGDIVEIVYGPFTNDEGVEMVTVKKVEGYNNDIPYENTAESKLNLNSVQAYAIGLKGEEVDDATKIMPQQFTFIMDYTDPNSGVEYKTGESILGYVTIEEGEPVVKKAKTVNVENEEITIPLYGYFSTDDREVEIQQGLIGRIARENGRVTTEIPIYVWDGEYDELVSMLPANEEINIMMYEKEDGFHLIGTTNNIELGDLAGYDVYEGLENYIQSMQPESINSYIEEQYPDGESTTYYYNGIFIPKEIANKDIGKYLEKQIYDINEGTKMPNTENSDSDITYVEITKDTDIIKRLKNVTNNTGFPYGLYIKYGSGEMTKDDVKNIVSQIENSEYRDYFQGGVIIKLTGLPEEKYQHMLDEYGDWIYDDDGEPITEINPDYTDKIEKINSLIDSLNELGVRVFILDSKDSSLNIKDITSKEIGYALQVKRDKDNRLNDEVIDYYKQKYEENSIKVSIWFDEEKGQFAVDDDIVREAWKAVADKNNISFTVADINWEQR